MITGNNTVIISGVSGAGKDTLLKAFSNYFKENVWTSTSYTTRIPREGEVHSEDYFFVSESEFEDLRASDFFIETAEVHGALYGTPLLPLIKAGGLGKLVLLNIDVQGGMKLHQILPSACFIFLHIDDKAQYARLADRGEQTHSIHTRTKNAQSEIMLARQFIPERNHIFSPTLYDAAGKIDVATGSQKVFEAALRVVQSDSFSKHWSHYLGCHRNTKTNIETWSFRPVATVAI